MTTNRMVLFDDLSPRERQVMSLVYRLEVATVAELHQAWDEAVSYNAVRRILDSLTDKSMVVYRREGRKYVYRPVHPKQEQGRQQLQRTLLTFFQGSPAKGFAALLSEKPDVAEVEELWQWLDGVRAELETPVESPPPAHMPIDSASGASTTNEAPQLARPV